MTGPEIIAIISISITGIATLMSTCFQSRCTEIDCLGIKCKRDVINETKT